MSVEPMTPKAAAEDRALAWVEAGRRYRSRAASMSRLRLQALASPHPHADTFAGFYAAVIRDDTERALFCDDVARACLADMEAA
jgi:hypothetical protein